MKVVQDAPQQVQTLIEQGEVRRGRGLEGRRLPRQSPDATATQAKVKKERTQPWVSRVRFKESRDCRAVALPGHQCGGDGGAKRGRRTASNRGIQT